MPGGKAIPGNFMTRPYYIADRRERDMIEFDELGRVVVVEHVTDEQRADFWIEWYKAKGMQSNAQHAITG